MKHIIAVLFVLTSLSLAQSQKVAPSPALMSSILDAWSTGGPAKAAVYYDKFPTDIFFDLAPLQYKGWSEYNAGAPAALGIFDTIKFTLRDDAKVHRVGNTAWATATSSVEGKLKSGNRVSFEGRWTVVWEKKGQQWLIVHEHFSAPWQPEAESRQR